jgi:hypothetical protein
MGLAILLSQGLEELFNAAYDSQTFIFPNGQIRSHQLGIGYLGGVLRNA